MIMFFHTVWVYGGNDVGQLHAAWFVAAVHWSRAVVNLSFCQSLAAISSSLPLQKAATQGQTNTQERRPDVGQHRDAVAPLSALSL